MSLVLNLDEGTTGKFSREPGDGANSVSEKFQRGNHLGVKTYAIMIKSLVYAKKILDPKKPSGNWIFLISCIIAITLDPLFFYIPVINDKKKCIYLDKKLGILATVLRSVIDLFHIIYITFQLRTDYWRMHKHSWAIVGKLLQLFLKNLFPILPLPQVVILFAILSIRGSKIFNPMHLLQYFVIFQHVPRAARIYPLFTEAMSNPRVADAAWTKSVFYLLLYMMAGHVIGAAWYFFAIQREAICWKTACSQHTGCDHGSFYCDDDHSSRNYTLLNKFCPTMTRDETIVDFGIYHDALRDGIVKMTDFPTKFSQCFLWGLQNLSSFGQGLQRSTYFLENIFVISIIIFSVVFFGCLLGNMQFKILSSEEMRRYERQIEQWKPFFILSQNLQQEIKKYLRCIWRESNGTGLEYLLSNLPKDLRSKINRELCFELLKNVEELGWWSRASLENLCDCLKPVIFVERTCIVREGDPIVEMLLVVRGKLWTYTSNGRTTDSASTNNRTDDNKSKKDHLGDGDFCGEEIVTWAMENPSSSNLPMSTRTIQALSNVEAFALMADDLKNVSNRYQISSREHSMTRAARVIQDAWHRHCTNRNP